MDRRALAVNQSATSAKVLVLSDGVAGHDRSSEGIVAALSRHRPIDVRWLAIRENRPASRRLARLSAAIGNTQRALDTSARLAPERLATAFAASAVIKWPAAADIVVSTGPATAATNIAAARYFGARNIFFGFPKRPVLGFSLLLSPVPSSARRVALCPRPSTIDAMTLTTPRPIGSPQLRVAVLFGGQSKHYAYAVDDGARLGQRLTTVLHAQGDWQLALFDSRRTHGPVFEALAAPLAPFGARVAVHRFAREGIGSNRTAFQADAILVTADSLSMITEAIASGRPTLAIRPHAYRGPARDRMELQALKVRALLGLSTFEALDDDAIANAPRPPRQSFPEALSLLLRTHGF